MGKAMSVVDLQEEFSETLRGVRAGTITVPVANSVKGLGLGILNGVKLQLAYCKLIGIKPNIPLLANPKAIGAKK
jgi:hypothetical protein